MFAEVDTRSTHTAVQSRQGRCASTLSDLLADRRVPANRYRCQAKLWRKDFRSGEEFAPLVWMGVLSGLARGVGKVFDSLCSSLERCSVLGPAPDLHFSSALQRIWTIAPTCALALRLRPDCPPHRFLWGSIAKKSGKRKVVSLIQTDLDLQIKCSVDRFS